MAGVAGFEPAHAGVKVLCLTAWRYPNFKQKHYSMKKCACQPKKQKNKSEMEKNVFFVVMGHEFLEKGWEDLTANDKKTIMVL